MHMYFNWLGEWKTISDDNDYIEDMKPSDFILNNLMPCTTKDILDNEMVIPVIVKISKGKHNYYIPISQLVWNERISDFSTEENW